MASTQCYDLYRNPLTGLLELGSNGDIKVITEYGEMVRQKIESVLRTFKGEVYDDETIGVPYYSEVLVPHPDTASITALLINQISAIDEVSKVQSVSVSFNHSTRTFSVQYKVVAKDQTLVEGTI